MKLFTNNKSGFGACAKGMNIYLPFLCAIALLSFSGFADLSALLPEEAGHDFLNNAGTVSYCQSKATNTSKGYIEKVSIETINNTSGNNGGYKDYTNLSANLQRGATYTIELTPGFVSGAAYFEYWTFYIDYNHDGIFEPGEMVEGRHSAIRINKSFTVPAGALAGNTRMRIQMQEGSQETDPCATYTYGEVEDYTVNITSSPSAANGSIKQDAEMNAVREEAPGTVTISPNPVAGASSRASYSLAKNGNVSLKVIDMNGTILRNISLGAQIAGKHDYLLNTASIGLHAGHYILVLEQDKQIIARSQFIVVH